MMMPLSRYRIDKKGRIRFTPLLPDDMALSSYPRSGNTWLRAILYQTRFDKDVQNLTALDYGIPDIYAPINPFFVYRQERYIFKTHEPYRWRSNYKNCVYIVRDPRDAVASFFQFATSFTGAHVSFEQFVEHAILGTQFPCSWFEHVNSWLLASKHNPHNIKICTFELLTQQDAGEIEKIAKTFGICVDALRASFKKSDISKMRQLEKDGNRNYRPAGSKFIRSERKDYEDQKKFIGDFITRYAPYYEPLIERFSFK